MDVWQEHTTISPSPWWWLRWTFSERKIEWMESRELVKANGRARQTRAAKKKEQEEYIEAGERKLMERGDV